MSQSYPVVAQPYVQNTSHTVVVTSHQVKQKRGWSSEMFSCFEDMTVCLCGTFCDACFMCYLSSKMGEHCCVPICVPGAIVAMRAALRERHGIEGSICNDCVCSTFCGPCVLCQLGRELKATGEWTV